MSGTRAAYLMARLTTKGLQPDMVFGSVPKLSRTDIAAACARLEPLHFHLIMAKYCDDVRSAIQALGELQEEMCRCHDLWAGMDPIRRSYVAAAMIDEFVSARKCWRCKGTGEKREGPRVVDCGSCDGSGQLRVSATSRARACEMPESTFRNQRIMEPFQEMIRRLADIELRALERISRKAS